MIDKILDSIDDYLRKDNARRGARFRSQANHASTLGSPCERELVYKRVDPDKALGYEPKTLGIFRLGNTLEKHWVQLFTDAGYEITHAQISSRWNEYNITGHIDGKLWLDDKPYIVEFKSMNPNTWSKIKSVDDLFDGDWTEKYIAQLLLYLWMEEHEEGFLILFNKSSAEMKILEVNLSDHLEFAESLIKKAESIEKHIKKGTLPDQINRRKICEKCKFFSHCGPTIDYGPGATMIQNHELSDLLIRRHLSKEEHGEYAKAHKATREYFKLPEGEDEGQWIVADDRHSWIVTGKRAKSGSVTHKFEVQGEEDAK